MFLKKILVFFLISLSSSSLILFSEVNCTASQNSSLYKNILPFIDLKILEEEYLVQQSWIIYPGGSVSNIRMANKNTRAAVNFNNNTGRTTRSGHWSYPHPCASQVIDGKKIEVVVYLKRDNKNNFTFSVPLYNKNNVLIITALAEKCFSPQLNKWTNTGISKTHHRDLTSSGTTYYIRTDGGSSSQCTGTSDAAYPGSGTNQPCAWSHPFWALDSGGAWNIQGGDTIVIGPGSYMMGYGAPNDQGLCESDYAWDCDLPPLPSGPDSNNPTRILGSGWDSGCSSAPELWGTQRAWSIIDLNGSSNVYIDCLEITDHSSCVENHSNASAECERNSYPFGEWASDGIVASDSSNVTLKNLDVHGLGSHGFLAGRLTDWSLENVRIAGNGWSGFDGDIDGSDSNNGTISFDDVVIEWNGCGETYPGEEPHNCWGQSAGGYGDGFGTGATGGHWIFRDCIVRYNTSDGLDLLYTRESGSQIDVKRLQSYGNAGNALKTTGNAAIENSLLVGNCGFFNGKSFTYNVDDCRAGGNTLNTDLNQGASLSVINSTIAGQGDCLISVECDTEFSSCNGSESVIVQNNIFRGYTEFGNPSDTTCYVWFDQDNYYNTQFDYNVIYNAKIGGTGYSANDINQDPLFTNASISSFDGHLLSGSPAIDSGLAVGSLGGLIPAGDLEGNSRPAGAGVDRGAYEYGASSSASITVTSPNGGESWAAGSSHAITWNSSGSVGNVKIDYSSNNGSSWSSVVSSTSNDGYYSWSVPSVSSSQCLVKVSESDGSPSDTSNAVFSITSGGGVPVISLSRSQLNFGASGSFSSGYQTFLVSNSGSGSLNWSASSNQSWLACSPTSGSNSGEISVSVDASGLSAGSYSGAVSVSDSNASNSPQSVSVELTVYASGNSSDPFGEFSTPTSGSTVSSSIPVTGWVLDDLGVAHVKIYRASGSVLVYIGDALLVEGARPDVELAYPSYPMNYKAGWGYMLLTNFLPNNGNGSFTLHAIATDVEGNQTSLGSKSISCDNENAVKPFGAIDTPTTGGSASGSSYRNAGWVLTPMPNMIPINGSTIFVYINGVSLGNPVYNLPREDIAGLFPGYANSNGAAGYFEFDSTAYANGVHTIAWSATDNDGNTDGIGSRYFTIQNTGNRVQDSPGANRLAFTEKMNRFPVDSSLPVSVKSGPANISPRILVPGEKGITPIVSNELDRLVIHLTGNTPPVNAPAARTDKPTLPAHHVTGFQLVGDFLRTLPVGSFLDSERGIFYWQPGPGFLGTFHFVFIVECADGVGVRKNIEVTIKAN